jgi:hypothetical protein
VLRDATVTWRTVLVPGARLPVDAGAPLGEAQLLVDGEVERSVSLLATGLVVAPERSGAAGVGAAVQEAIRAFTLSQPFERAA